MTATYNASTNTIELYSGMHTPESIATQLNNPSIFSWDSITKTAVTNANILVKSDKFSSAAPPTTELDLIGGTFIFNGGYELLNNAILKIDDNTITSTSNVDGQRGRIKSDGTYRGVNMYNFSLTNSSLSRLGDENMRGISTHTIVDHKLVIDPIIINNNDFNDVKSFYVQQGSNDAFITNNVFHDMKSTAGIGTDAYFANNTIYNYSSNYMFMTRVEEGRNPIIINNMWYNNDGTHLRIKQGLGGATVKNNIIKDGYGHGIMDAGSVRTEWNIIEDNIIDNITCPKCTGNGCGFYTAGDCGGGAENYTVKTRFVNNTIKNCGTGIFIHDYCNFPPYYSGYRDAIISGNTIINNATSGITLRGDPYTNVSILNNNISSVTGYDILFKSTMGSSSPKFINLKFSTIKLEAGVFLNYYYCNVHVIDGNDDPIKNATIDITNITDSAYPSINIEGNQKTTFITDSYGNTPLPDDIFNSIALLVNAKTTTSNIIMSYDINATFNGVSNKQTLTLDDTWYRPHPLVPLKSLTIKLDTLAVCPRPMCDINISVI